MIKNREKRLEELRGLLRNDEEENNDNFFMKKYDKMKNLKAERFDYFLAKKQFPMVDLRYPPEKSRQEVDLFEQLYRLRDKYLYPEMKIFSPYF